MKRIFIGIFAMGLFTTVALFVAGVGKKNLAAEKNITTAESKELGWSSGTFVLTDDKGREFKSESLRGKVWVANFIFTSCQGPCPLLVEKFRGLNEIFGSVSDFSLVSISVDPETDTPQVLQRYRNEKHALAPNWAFLTGSHENILQIIRELFRVPVDESPDIHTTRFLLVDRRGNVRKSYDSADEKEMAALRKDIHQLLANES